MTIISVNVDQNKVMIFQTIFVIGTCVYIFYTRMTVPILTKKRCANPLSCILTYVNAYSLFTVS